MLDTRDGRDPALVCHYFPYIVTEWYAMGDLILKSLGTVTHFVWLWYKRRLRFFLCLSHSKTFSELPVYSIHYVLFAANDGYDYRWQFLVTQSYNWELYCCWKSTHHCKSSQDYRAGQDELPTHGESSLLPFFAVMSSWTMSRRTLTELLSVDRANSS